MGKNLMTDEYNATLIDIKNIIFQSRDKAQKVIGYATLDTYWKIGKRIFKEERICIPLKPASPRCENWQHDEN